MKKKLWLLSFIMAIMFMMAGANLASASIVTLTSQITSDASSVDIEPGDGTIGTVPGMTNWTILGGASQLELQWFWFKIGDGYSTRLGQPIQTSVDGGGAPVYAPNPTVTELDSSTSMLLTKYEYDLGDPDPLTFWTTYSIYGGDNPPMGHISEVINVLNQTEGIINLRLYEYNDFNLLGTPGWDDAVAVSDTQISQYEGTAAIAEVTRSVVPAIGHYEIGEQVDILAAVIAGDTLGDIPTPYGTVYEGNADNDTAWAFSWDFSLAAYDGSFTLSKDKIVVTPIPTTLLLFGSGLFSLIGVGIRRRKS